MGITAAVYCRFQLSLCLAEPVIWGWGWTFKFICSVKNYCNYCWRFYSTFTNVFFIFVTFFYVFKRCLLLGNVFHLWNTPCGKNGAHSHFCPYLWNAFIESNNFGTHKQQFMINSVMCVNFTRFNCTTVGGVTKNSTGVNVELAWKINKAVYSSQMCINCSRNGKCRV